MYVCSMIVCMCADCMYAIVVNVCMYAEKRKNYTILNVYVGLAVLASSMCTGLLIS